MSRRVTFGFIAIAFSLGVVVGAWALHLYSGLVVPGRQIRNLANMQFWQRVLSDSKERTGTYPESLEQALSDWESSRDGPLGWNPLQDNWGREYAYVRVPDGYVLASYGRDGNCDMRDIQAYASWSVFDTSPCYSSRRDTVLTDHGFVKGCGK